MVVVAEGACPLEPLGQWLLLGYLQKGAVFPGFSACEEIFFCKRNLFRSRAIPLWAVSRGTLAALRCQRGRMPVEFWATQQRCIEQRC